MNNTTVLMNIFMTFVITIRVLAVQVMPAGTMHKWASKQGHIMTRGRVLPIPMPCQNP